MGSHILDILRQGIWASVSGGWFYDPQLSVFCNTFHLYLWMFLLAFPLILHLTLESSVLVWGIYCGSLGVVLSFLKFVNFRLHHLFDTGEVFEDTSSKANGKDSSGTGSKIESNGNIESFELMPIRHEPLESGPSTGPSTSGETTEIRSNGSKSDKPEKKESNPNEGVPLAEQDDEIEAKAAFSAEGATGGIELSAEGGNYTYHTYHQPHLSSPAVLNICEEQQKTTASVKSNKTGRKTRHSSHIPHRITTKADIESCLQDSDGEIELGELRLNMDIDSPYTAIRPRRERKAVKRSKSALEPSQVVILPGDRASHLANLPVHPKIKELSDPFPELMRYSPSEQTTMFGQKQPINEGDMTIIDLELLDYGRIRPRTSSLTQELDRSAGPKHTPERKKTSKSHSVDRGRMRSKHRDQKRPSSRKPHLVETESGSSELYVSDSKLVMRSGTNDRDPIKSILRTNSVPETDKAQKIKSILRSPPKDLSLPSPVTSVVPRKESQCSSGSTSHQSSIVGLEWLFSGDSDSLTSDESHSPHPISTDTSSTVTNEDHLSDSSVGLNQYKLLTETVTFPSSPSADEMEFQRKHIDFPKHPKHPDELSIVSSTETDTQVSSPLSTDTSDAEEFQRKLMDILSDNKEKLQKIRAMFDHRRRSSDDSFVSQDSTSGTIAVKGDLLEEPGTSGATLDMENKSESKSVTPTENSALLPTSGSEDHITRLTRKTGRRRHRWHGNQMSKRRSRRDSPHVRNLSSVNLGSNVHMASSHSDTTEGALHCFQDNDGHWFSYTFGKGSDGVAVSVSDVPEIIHTPSWNERSSSRWSVSSSGSGSTLVVEESRKNSTEREDEVDSIIDPEPTSIPGLNMPLQSYVAQLLENGRSRLPTTDTSSDSEMSGFTSHKEKKPKHFYKFWVLPKKKFFKVWFDRLALLALLDRNLSVIENSIAVIMAVFVGGLGALVLSSGFYQDFWIFLFCFILAGCQYSVLKSVQPDAASPMHGYNRLIVFSRPFYFCLCCGLVLLLDYASIHVSLSPVNVYGIPFTTKSSLVLAKDFLRVFILCLPIIFTLGLLPQVNTFTMYVLEQVDMHIFGGNSIVGLIAAFVSTFRSVFAVAFLYIFGYLALQNVGTGTACNDRESAQNVIFSVFCALLITTCYHLSRSASDPSVLWMLIKDLLCGEKKEDECETEEGKELVDPLPNKLKKCVCERLQSDLLVILVILVIVFAVHVSTAFSSPIVQPLLTDIICYLTASIGFIIHYIIPQLRKEMPWLCISHPVLSSQERKFFDISGPAHIMWFEKFYVWLRFFERNVLYPVVFLCALTSSAPPIVCKFGYHAGPLVVIICGMKILRFSFCCTQKQYLVLTFTLFFFKFDYRWASETFLIDYFFISILLCKFMDLMLKMKFIITYIAPWQITWGSAFHAFAQPFSVPHSAMLFLQAAISAFFSTPLNPFLGSAIFITSYIRPVKFWEKDYNTKRVDHSNTRLSSQLERNPGADDNNLNSIFYEHLTRSLQHSLCGDLMMGRWGNVDPGDCFIMASDYLNALVHIIEVGNGLVTFQLRGLEFRGTYCQQREVEAITEGVEDNEGLCCFEPGHLPHFLSLNAAFNERWLAWEVVVTKYILEGYSISDNSAASMVQVFDFRKVLITYYIKSIIYYTVRSPRLEEWLTNGAIVEGLGQTTEENYVDLDPTFYSHVDDDYDSKLSGISRNSFCAVYLDWVQFCASRRDKVIDNGKQSMLVSLCYGLSLLGRRALGTASHNTHNSASVSVDFFLYGLHALFKGDFRITSTRDEWVFADMELLRRVVAPAIRMSLKLHQDHFLCIEYDDNPTLYEAITNYEHNLVISHEADPAWRNAVLSNTPFLLALRHVFDEGSDEYKVIMLSKKYLSFRVVKVNRECVRGLWAGQQQELIYLRNRNPERGSIQNAKQALRNMINSSCDQPIGYPIYVSPLTTSYSSTNQQLRSIIGGEFIIANVKSFFQNVWKRMRQRCDVTCTGSSGVFQDDAPYALTCTHTGAASALGYSGRGTPGSQHADIALQPLGNRGSLVSTTSSASKPSALAQLTAGFMTDTSSVKETVNLKVRIMDTGYIYDNINLGRRIDVQWPNDEWRQNGGRNGWSGWIPMKGMEGVVVHRWAPCHRDILRRSHVDKTILLIQMGDKYVPIGEPGVMELGAEV